MHKLKYMVTDLLKKPLATRQRWLKNGNLKQATVRLVDVVLTLIPVFATIALFTLIWLYVRPLKLADIKVPVATDQASYYPGEEISGIFFGEIYYRGDVKVLRQVFCKDYVNIIEPPESAQNGDFYDTQSIPRKLEGLNVNIGLLPPNIPVGSNCVLQFTNVYHIQTPFGGRHETYQYYTQNFSIVTRERRQQLECESSGRKDCNFLSDGVERETSPQGTEAPGIQYSPESAPNERSDQPSSQGDTFNDNRTTVNNPPPEPEPAPRFEERCTIDFILKINCRQVPIQ